MQFTVAQPGAREHYTVPRALHELGQLRVLYTDMWARSGRSVLSLAGGRSRALANRFHPDLRFVKVVSCTPFSVMHTFFSQLPWNKTDSISKQYLQHIKNGKVFTSFVLKHLKKETLKREEDVYFGYDGASLEILEYLYEKQIFSSLIRLTLQRQKKIWFLKNTSGGLVGQLSREEFHLNIMKD